MRIPRLGFLVLALLVWSPQPALGQNGPNDPESAPGPVRLDQARVELDGKLDEAAWTESWTIPALSQVVPNEGDPPRERTDVHIFYDDQAIYLGARVHEADPNAIVDRYFERDAFEKSGQDGVALILDTDGDPRTGYGFIVTPSGGKSDIALSERQGDPIWNLDWNTFWDVETSRDQDGWSLEMRIPFSSLRFEPGPDGRVKMGIVVWRYLARNGEFDVYPKIPNNWRNSAYKVALGTPVVFAGVEPRRPLYVKPYVLLGMDERHRLNQAGDAYLGARESIHSLGGDAKYNVTSNLILDLTANTDFAQVESDDQILNLERFSLFFPEKRDFFQERADLFEFSIPGAQDRLFHSRAIGIVDGQRVPIRGGGRLTGHYAGWDVGVVSMETGGATVNGRDVAAENFGVVRLRRPFGGKGSYVGGIVTTRTDFGDASNVVIGLDADTHVIGDYFIDTKIAQTIEPGSGFWGRLLVSAYLQRRNVRGFLLATSYRYLGADFKAGVGFMQRTGYQRAAHRTQYAWFPKAGLIQNHNVSHLVQIVWDERFRALETHFERLSWNIDFRNNSSANAEVNFTRDVVDKPFKVGSLVIPVGTFDFPGVSARYSSRSGRPFQLGGTIKSGGYYGGTLRSGGLEFTWNPGPLLSLGAEGDYDRIRLPSGDYDALITRVRIGTAFSRSLTANTYLQHNASDHVLSPNVRIRYNPREGSDLYLVYNEGLNTSLTPAVEDSPRLPRSQARSIQLKYTYTFVH